MATVTWTGSVSTTYSTDGNWDTGSKPTSSDDVIIANVTNDCVLTGSPTVNSWTVESGARFNGNTETITVVGENSSGFAIDIDGEIVGTTTNFTVETSTTTTIDLTATSGNVRHLTINHASANVFYSGATTLTGNLNVTLGTLNCSHASGNFTVAGRTDIGPASGSADQATLNATDCNISLGSGRTSSHALIINQGGTFVGGTGTHTIGSLNIKNNTNCKCTLTSGDTTINGENGSTSKAINIEGSNGTVNFSHGSGTVIITFNGSSDIKADGVTLNLNNLTINHADADINTKSNLTCAGDVTITAGILDGEDDAISFGSLTISNNGTYDATSGTTTITNETSGGFAIDHDGTFTHNKGKVNITTANTSIDIAGTGNLYDLEINGFVKLVSGNYTIDNNVTIASGHTFTTNNLSTSVTVLGNVNVSGTFWRTDNSGTVTLGGLTINSGGTYNATNGTTIMKGALRNLGGTIS